MESSKKIPGECKILVGHLSPTRQLNPRNCLVWRNLIRLAPDQAQQSRNANSTAYVEEPDKSGVDVPNALPNVGRETHTYLHHILTQYPQFPEYTVFLQGWPFEHLPEHAGPAEFAAMIDAAVQRRALFKGFAY